MSKPTAPPRHIRVTDIGEYVRHQSCARRFALGYDNQAAFKALPFSGRPYNLMDPVLAEAGKQREQDWAQSLEDLGFRALELPEREPGKGAPWEAFAALPALTQPGPCFAREVQLEGAIGAFYLYGRVDFVLLRPHPEGGAALWLVECKASRRDRTYQRLQVVLYKMMLSQLLAQQPLKTAYGLLGPESIEVAVVRIDETTHQMISLDHLTALTDTCAYERDLLTMLATAGQLEQALEAPLEQLPYRLESKCDDCVFHVHCMAESARQRRLELLGLSPDLVRALVRVGVADIDALSSLNLSSLAAEQLREDADFTADTETLRALARARMATLPAHAPSDYPEYQVVALPHQGRGHLPEHRLYDAAQLEGMTRQDRINAQPEKHALMRIFLSVHYDYAENRVVALAAHFTDSQGHLQTPMHRDDQGRMAPDPELVELDPSTKAPRPLRGQTIVEVKQGPWSGRYEEDCAHEGALLHTFFGRLVRQLQLEASSELAPVHFYLWSSQELRSLLEACERAGGGMLGFLRELLGCRESLEQLIYSSLEEEVRTRFALAWTGYSLTLATSLTWFGARYHWRRRVGRQEVDLDRSFWRDLFDFRAELELDDQGQWCREDHPKARAITTQLRPRFYDNLTSPYWRAFWGTLPDPDDPSAQVPAALKASMREYRQAGQAGLLEAYLEARVHALRWLEERIICKNGAIRKTLVELEQLPRFRLETQDAARAAIDHMRLDQHVKFTQWMAAHMVPPYLRVATGASLPVRDVQIVGDDPKSLVATLDPAPYYTTLDQLRARTSIDEGKMVRMHPAEGTPLEAQRLNAFLYEGLTCMLSAVDWTTGHIALSVIPSSRYQNEYYTLKSATFDEGKLPFALATLDASITNFVDARVERQLSPKDDEPLKGAYVLSWFDPARPRVPAAAPAAPAALAQLRRMLEALRLPVAGTDSPLEPARVEIILRGLETRIQLIQGPPGTGKTMVTALALLTRILAGIKPGQIVLVTAHTHTAVDTLLARVARVLDAFNEAATSAGVTPVAIQLAKVFSGDAQEVEAPGVEAVRASGDYTQLKRWSADHVVVLGSTTSTILKLVTDLDKKSAYKERTQRFQTPLLIVDEASMMVFAHFLALTTLLEQDGALLLAGDHRQLSPIVAHDWDREDRPPAQYFRMYDSAFNTIARLRDPQGDDASLQRLRLDDRQIRRDGLELTYRLPASIRALIQPLYDRDGLVLRGPSAQAPAAAQSEVSPGLGALWTLPYSLYLVLHDEVSSHQRNPLEAYLARHILDAGLDGPGVDPGSVVLMTPHRAQRALLKTFFEQYQDCVAMIDTVERMQGGEAQTIIYSATVSDPVAIAQETEFILNLERSNVAFSRTQRRLIVLCSRALINFVPPRHEDYEAAILWKNLRRMCRYPIAAGELGEHRYEVLVAHAP